MYAITQCPLSQNTLKAECVALVQRNGELEERLAEVRSVNVMRILLSLKLRRKIYLVPERNESQLLTSIPYMYMPCTCHVNAVPVVAGSPSHAPKCVVNIF